MATWKRFVEQTKESASSKAPAAPAKEKEISDLSLSGDQKEDLLDLDESIEFSPSIRKLSMSKMSRSKLRKCMNQSNSQP